jgi:hypothetical protein
MFLIIYYKSNRKSLQLISHPTPPSAQVPNEPGPTHAEPKNQYQLLQKWRREISTEKMYHVSSLGNTKKAQFGARYGGITTHEVKRIMVGSWPGQKWQTLYENQTKNKRVKSVAQVVKCWP